MAATVALVTAFGHLNDDRTLTLRQNSASRERSAVVDITFDGAGTYTTGGVIVDFTGIRRFKQVYFLDVGHTTYVLPVNFVPGAGNDASLGKLKFFDSSGAELGAGSA